jgi:hypothetical protein
MIEGEGREREERFGPDESQSAESPGRPAEPEHEREASEPSGADEEDRSGPEEKGAGEQPRAEAEGGEEEPQERESGGESESGALAGEAAAGPSMGPHTDVSKFREGREEGLRKAAEASDTDALGREKRRQVVGGTYGMTTGKLVALYAATVAVIAGAAFGLYLLAKDLDQPPEQISQEAPWAGQDAPQREPKPIQ